MSEYNIKDSITNAGYDFNEGDTFTSQRQKEGWEITSIENAEVTFTHPDGSTITIAQRNHPEGDLPFEVRRPTGDNKESVFEADFFNQALTAAEVYMMGYNDGKE
jgi:hypothetical protein